MPVGSRMVGVVSMTSLRLALGMAVGLTISAAAWGLARNGTPDEEPVLVEPSTRPGVIGPGGRGDAAGFGSGPGSPSASVPVSGSPSPGATPSGTRSPGVIIGLPPIIPPPLAPREPVPSGPSSPRPTRPTEQEAPAGNVLTAEFSFSSTWAEGFVASVEVANATGRAQSWEVRLSFPATVTVPEGSAWNARQSGEEGTIVFTGGPVPAGATQTFGFQAEKAAQNRKDFEPTACTVNGLECRGF